MALRMLLGRNVCRHVSSRFPAVSSNSVASSPRGGIPLGARYYSNSKNSSSAEEPFEITVGDVFFGIFITWWGCQLRHVDWKGENLQSIEELTKDTSEYIVEVEVEIEQLRAENGRMKKLLEENLGSKLDGSKRQVTNIREVPQDRNWMGLNLK